MNNIIKKVLWGFQAKIKSKQLNVYIAQKQVPDFKIKADWDNYELIMFNLIQNAVKYNVMKGDIYIIVSYKKRKTNDYKIIPD